MNTLFYVFVQPATWKQSVQGREIIFHPWIKTFIEKSRLKPAKALI